MKKPKKEKQEDNFFVIIFKIPKLYVNMKLGLQIFFGHLGENKSC